jgi:hypothetical protein
MRQGWRVGFHTVNDLIARHGLRRSAAHGCQRAVIPRRASMVKGGPAHFTNSKHQAPVSRTAPTKPIGAMVKSCVTFKLKPS